MAEHECPHCKAMREAAERAAKEQAEREAEARRQRKSDGQAEPKACCCSHAKAQARPDEESVHENCCGIATHRDEEVVHENCCGIATHRDEGGGHENCCGIASGASSSGAPSVLRRYRTPLTLGIALLSVVVSFVLQQTGAWHGAPLWVGIFDPAWVAVALCGVPIYRGAMTNLFRRKRITSALLISLAMTASLIMGFLTAAGVTGEGHGHSESYFFAAGEIAFLMGLGSWIEDLTVGKARSAVRELIRLQPQRAHLKTENGYTEVDASEVRIGDIVLIKPNEAVSVDGVVVGGEGSVNTASITGESTPVDVAAGSEVYAGSLNLSTALEVRATRVSGDTTLGKLIEYVKNAEKNRAPIVRLADKWARYLVPAACLISVAIFFVALFGLQVGVLEAVKRAITILVVVCPCALTLATPIAVSAGIGNAGRKGILIKNGTALERLAGVDVVAFDKTGTLTTGELRVAGTYPYGVESETLLYYAAGAETQSEHPIARAVIAAAGENRGVPTRTESMVGYGVRAVVDGKRVEVVKLQAAEIPADEKEKIEGDKTAIAVLLDGRYIGAITVGDTVKAEAKDAVAALKKAGRRTVMLTGDSRGAAEKVAREIGIDVVAAELLPEGKVAYLQQLKEEGRQVLMVGDGVNDAPAMATSTCSLAMGAMGSSVAIETADASLLGDDLNKIPFMLSLSKRTLRTIAFNITLSLSISFAAIFLSATGLINAVWGALLHNASSVLVCLNSALILTKKK